MGKRKDVVREHLINLLVTPVELFSLQEMARQRDVTLSTLLRQAIEMLKDRGDKE